MSVGKITVAGLAILLGVVVAAHALLTPDVTRRNFTFLPEMVTPVPYESQGENPNFPDGQNLRSPVPGALPRGFVPLHYGPGDPEALRAGAELINPYLSSDAAAKARGAFVWRNFCQMCHGPDAEGNGPATLRGVPAPPSFHTETARARKDGELFHIITYGRNNGNMPSHAVQVSAEDRWKAILHIRTLQEARLQKERNSTPPPGAQEGK